MALLVIVVWWIVWGLLDQMKALVVSLILQGSLPSIGTAIYGSIGFGVLVVGVFLIARSILSWWKSRHLKEGSGKLPEPSQEAQIPPSQFEIAKCLNCGSKWAVEPLSPLAEMVLRAGTLNYEKDLPRTVPCPKCGMPAPVISRSKDETLPPPQPELTIAPTDLEEHEKIKEIELALQDGNVIRHEARFYYITVRNLGKQSAEDVGGTYLSQQMIFVPLNRKQRFRVEGRYDTDGFKLATEKFQSREEAIIVALLNDERWVMKQRITVHPDSVGETFVLFFTLKGLNVLTIPGGTRIYPNDKERMPCTITLPIHLTGKQIPEHVVTFKVNVRDWKHFKVDQIVQTTRYPAS